MLTLCLSNGNLTAFKRIHLLLKKNTTTTKTMAKTRAAAVALATTPVIPIPLSSLLSLPVKIFKTFLNTVK